MSRVINLDSPGKLRSQLMRTSAELIRHLVGKADLDDEARDMVAFLVFCLREIDQGVDSSALAWEKRNYWVKAERFRARWAWAGYSAAKLEKIIWEENWEQLPMTLIKLLPYFEDIKVAKFTRKPHLWRGAYERLLNLNADGNA